MQYIIFSISQVIVMFHDQQIMDYIQIIFSCSMTDKAEKTAHTSWINL